MDPELRKVSVITVTLNTVSVLEKTIRSVLEQDHVSIEYIIIDGGSMDGSANVIRKYEEKIHFWISEPDKGVYDAMNKGLAKATGDWVGFMNAGDTFYDSHTVSSVFDPDPGDAGVIYGDTIADYSYRRIYKKAGAAEQLWKGMVMCHQSVFIRTALVKPEGFDPDYKIGSDYDMILRLYLEGRHFKYVHRPVSVIDTKGISNQHMVSSAKEHFAILGKYNMVGYKTRLFHYCFILWLFFISGVNSIIPNSLRERTNR